MPKKESSTELHAKPLSLLKPKRAAPSTKVQCACWTIVSQTLLEHCDFPMNPHVRPWLVSWLVCLSALIDFKRRFTLHPPNEAHLFIHM